MYAILILTTHFIWTYQVEAILGKWHHVSDDECSYTHYRQPIRNAMEKFEFVIERTENNYIIDALRKDLLKFAFRKDCPYHGIAIFRSGKFELAETNAYMFVAFEAEQLFEEGSEGDEQNPGNGRLVIRILACGILNQEFNTVQYQPLNVVEKAARLFGANWALPVDSSPAPPEGQNPAGPVSPAESSSNPREKFAKLRSSSQKFLQTLQRTNSQIEKAKGLFRKRTESHATLNTISTSNE